MFAVSREEVARYYREVDFRPLFNIDRKFFKHRQVRVMGFNGAMIKVRRTITDAGELKRVLVQMAPARAYYTVARFLNPVSVGPREINGPGYRLADSCFLTQDEFVFDIDEDPERNLKLLLDFLKRRGLPIKYVIDSGRRGYQVAIKRRMALPIGDPRERERYFLEANKQLLEEVWAEGIGVDDTSNTRQIVKIPLSFDAVGGRACRLLWGQRPHGMNPERAENNRGVLGTGPTRPPRQAPPKTPWVGVVVSNNVLGTRGLYVPFLKFNRPIEYVIGLARDLVRTYDLSGILLLEREGRTYGIGVDALPRRRLEKVLRRGNQASMLNALRKYKRNVVPVSVLRKADRGVWLRGQRRDRPVSKGHVGMLANLRLERPERYTRLVGSSRVQFAIFAGVGNWP